jgi:hypothetical protein
MPNWVQTSLEITGPKKELDRFSSMVKEVEAENWRGDKYLEIRLIESFIPCPQELYEVVSPVREEQTALALEMMAKYGSSNWYDWQYENWGVKWGDSSTELDDSYEDGLFYRYQTPWGSADVAFKKISAMFPELRFQFFYDEEAGFFCGCHVMQAGEVIFDEMFAPCEYKEDVDWDDEESCLKYEEWRNENIFKIEARADAA